MTLSTLAGSEVLMVTGAVPVPELTTPPAKEFVPERVMAPTLPAFKMREPVPVKVPAKVKEAEECVARFVPLVPKVSDPEFKVSALVAEACVIVVVVALMLVLRVVAVETVPE